LILAGCYDITVELVAGGSNSKPANILFKKEEDGWCDVCVVELLHYVMIITYTTVHTHACMLHKYMLNTKQGEVRCDEMEEVVEMNETTKGLPQTPLLFIQAPISLLHTRTK